MSAITEPLISRAEWLLDPNVSFLNHGSFGAVPRAQPTAFPHFCKVFYECAKRNKPALTYACILAALYLHLRPFSRFIVASVDRQIASIDSGAWDVRLPRPQLAEARS